MFTLSPQIDLEYLDEHKMRDKAKISIWNIWMWIKWGTKFLNSYGQWSLENWSTVTFSTGGSTDERACLFFKRNSSRRLAFLLCVEGLAFFLATNVAPALPLVSKEKVKVGPMLRVKWKVRPWLASAWQNSMHLEAREQSASPAVAIYLTSELWNYRSLTNTSCAPCSSCWW